MISLKIDNYLYNFNNINNGFHSVWIFLNYLFDLMTPTFQKNHLIIDLYYWLFFNLSKRSLRSLRSLFGIILFITYIIIRLLWYEQPFFNDHYNFLNNSTIIYIIFNNGFRLWYLMVFSFKLWLHKIVVIYLLLPYYKCLRCPRCRGLYIFIIYIVYLYKF